MTLHHASTLLELGRHEEALRALSSLGDEGSSAQAHGLRARAYLGLRRFKEADKAAAAAIVAAPDWEWGYRLAAITARRRGRKKDARALAREAVRVGPHEPYAHQIAALTAIDDGDRAVALQHAQTMTELAPNDPVSHRTLGRCLLVSGQRELAESSLRRCLQIDPQDHEAMSLLADIVGRRDRAGATDLRVQALRSNPQSQHYRKDVLRRGGLGLAGGLVLVGKLGLLGKLAAFAALRGLGAVVGGAVLVTLLVLVLGGAFVVTRVRRSKVKGEVPALVWEGLRAERRNADLLWLAWPAGLVLFGSVFAVLGQFARGTTPWGAAWLAGAVVVLAVCWVLRLGDARQLTVWDVLRRLGRGARATVGR